MNFTEIKEIKDKIMRGYEITRAEALELSQSGHIEALYYSANQLRAKFCGFKFEMCSMFDVSRGRCEEDCHWCPLSKQSTIDYAALEKPDFNIIFERIVKLREKGVHRIELSSINHVISDEELDKMIVYFNTISQKSDIGLCASLGTLSLQQLQRLKAETKVKRYHCNIETSERYYPQVCTTNDIHEKYRTLLDAQKVGFEACSGGIIGMGETMEDRIDMALKLRELGVRSISMNILFAFNGTPFETHQMIGSQEILTTFALFRFINPRAQIRFARGRSQIKIIEKEALQAGINASAVGEILVAAKSTDIDNDIKVFKSEGFIL
ncbi:MAG: biotin synthase BioB [Bacteroidales bacterium]|nr:biotin synthase BioB [Bacteroidales bacterium]